MPTRPALTSARLPKPKGEPTPRVLKALRVYRTLWCSGREIAIERRTIYSGILNALLSTFTPQERAQYYAGAQKLRHDE